MIERSNPALLGVLIAIECAAIYSQYLPSIFTIRHFGAQEGTVENIRIGEVIGTVNAVILSGLASAIIGNPAPFLFTIPIAAATVGVYEWALRNPDGGAQVME